MIDYQKRVLGNGLTVVTEQDETTAMAAVNILYKVGSRDENPERTGFAHLFEHLMFGGSKHAPNFDTPLQNVGGENNAYTNNDYTNFYNVLPVENIETALWLEADRMANLVFSAKSLNTQKKVVIEEFSEVCLNMPYGDSWHHLSALAYESHPYRWPTIGLVPDHIKEAKLIDVKTFFAKYYHPTNAVLSISSALSAETVFEIAEKWFGHIENKPEVQRSLTKEALHKGYKEKIVYGEVPGPMILMGFHMPGRHVRDYYICDLITDIMSNGQSSRFYAQLVRKQKLVSGIDCYITGTVDPGLIIIEAKPMPGRDIDLIIAAIWKLLEELKTNKVRDREFNKIKNKVISSLAMSDVSVLNKAISMAYFESLDLLQDMNEQEAIYDSITQEEVMLAAQQYLKKNNLVVLKYLAQNGSM